jgi:mannose-6-phosphate isomerase
MHKLIEEFGQFVFARTLPLWRDHGWDAPCGGFYDRLSRRLVANPSSDKRLMVQCRQLYVYSLAELMRPDQGWRAVAENCFDFLETHYRDKKYGGWFFSVTSGGAPAVRTKDCYGHAFVLFGLAHYYAATGSRSALEFAEETVDLLERHLSAREGGFHSAAEEDWKIIPDIRRQNPHMHLLEGFIALFEATGSARYRKHAEQIIELFSERLFDRTTSTVGEFFDARWQPAVDSGHKVEPGHHFEWYWLLRRFEKIIGPLPEAGIADSVFSWATRHGIDHALGGVFDQNNRSGEILVATKRFWPIAEAIKAHALRATEHAHAQTALHGLIKYLLEHYQDSNGLLVEHLDHEGRAIITDLYASSQYHLLFAYSEAAKAF